MPTNAEIKAAIDLIIRSPHNHILTGAVADILDDIVDNISAGPGGTPGIDSVLAEAEALTANRSINLNGNGLHLSNGSLGIGIAPETQEKLVVSDGLNKLIVVNTDDFNTRIEGNDNTAQTYVNASADLGEGSVFFDLFSDNGTNQVQIKGDAIANSITHTADTHTFNINGVLSAIFNGNNFLLIDPTVNDESAAIQANNITGAGNLANVRAFTDDTSAGAVLLGTFNNDKQFSISGSADASGSSLTYTADDHIFSIVQVFADNAAAVTGGLAVGTLYRTGDALKIVHV